MSTQKIDTEWFTRRLIERQLSQRGLAKLMGLDPAAISLTFRGKRKLTLEEAAQLAVLLDAPTSEVLSRAGLPMYGESKVPLVGIVQAAGHVVMHGEGAHEMVEAPPGIPTKSIALQARTAGTAEAIIDGWLYFASADKGNPANYLGEFVICAIKGNGLKTGHIAKGYTRGSYNLVLRSGAVEQNLEMAWASPIFWIKTRI